MNYQIRRPKHEMQLNMDVRMLLKGPTGHTATVKTGWIIDDGSEEPQLVSAYIYKEKG